jgi:hypothetical protein
MLPLPSVQLAQVDIGHDIVFVKIYYPQNMECP